MKDIKNESKLKMSFSALEPFVETNIISAKEDEVRGQSFISWGDGNIYPEYLWELYQKTPTLKSIINGVVDYVAGDSVKSNTLTLSDDKADDLVRDMALSYAIYGGFALNVLRNRLGGIADIIPVSLRNVRSDKKSEFLYYSEDFGKKSYGRGKYITYPRFDAENTNIGTSIFYYKNVKGQTYPTPVHGASVIACEIEKNIAEYQLNAISNGFASNVIVSMNNGIPTDEMKEEIEEMFDEKFTGYENAGRPMIVYSADKEHSVEIAKVDTDGFIDKYNSASAKSRQDIFTAWRANPNLFGIPTENLGFSSEEYESSFKLFNRTVVKPIQKLICKTLDKITGIDGTITIEPFTLDGKKEDDVE